jgi:hypothetical protein
MSLTNPIPDANWHAEVAAFIAEQRAKHGPYKPNYYSDSAWRLHHAWGTADEGANETSTHGAGWRYVAPAFRFDNAQSWVLGSTLTLRHPELELVESHPGDGMGTELVVRELGDRHFKRTHVRIGRGGTIRVEATLPGREARTTDVATTSKALGMSNTSELVNLVERLAEWRTVGLADGPAGQRGARGGRARSYAFISALLSAMLNDDFEWHVANARDWGWWNSPSDIPRYGGIEVFPHAVLDAAQVSPQEVKHGIPEVGLANIVQDLLQHLERSPTDDLLDVGSTTSTNWLRGYWVIFRGTEPVGVVSEKGRLFRSDGRTVLFKPPATRSMVSWMLAKYVGPFLDTV